MNSLPVPFVKYVVIVCRNISALIVVIIIQLFISYFFVSWLISPNPPNIAFDAPSVVNEIISHIGITDNSPAVRYVVVKFENLVFSSIAISVISASPIMFCIRCVVFRCANWYVMYLQGWFVCCGSRLSFSVLWGMKNIVVYIIVSMHANIIIVFILGCVLA